MIMDHITIATRGSLLAMWQARWVQDLLQKAQERPVHIKTLKTTGDLMQDKSTTPVTVLSSVPHWSTGKGVFVKEIQQALIAGDAQIAVHSMKDVPIPQTPGLCLAGMLPRAAANDVIVLSPKTLKLLKQYENVPNNKDLESIKYALLKSGGAIGTTSGRRRALAAHFFEGVPCQELRGNVDSRLKKVMSNEFGAILLAKAGLDRLNLFNPEFMRDLSPGLWVPASCQGIVALEISQNADPSLVRAVYSLTHCTSAIEAVLERSVLGALGGDCHTPTGIFCLDGKTLICVYGFHNSLHKFSWNIPQEVFDYLKLHTGKGWENLVKIWSETHWALDLKNEITKFKEKMVIL